ncbi:MAG: GreA/GreB family elongation factor [Bacteroidales bacterium]|nr:GreA/GreB family elongation factor [Bacteroidales bacterium]MBN2817350.1 GreA/GreB family elongation factor [Bacteroidales bacterium]
MEGQIVITELDYIRLSKLIGTARMEKSVELKNLEVLANEIKRAKKINSKKITPEFVTMNSVVKVFNKKTKQTMTVKIVYPKEADFKKSYVSVFSPLGSALLGYKVGDSVLFEAPKAKVEIIIENIEYQPEASGDFFV